MPKIAVVGAGSIVFSRNLISDILAFDALKQTHFALVDIDPERLALVEVMAKSISKTRKADAKVTAGADRRAALEGADFVINTVGVGGIEATRTDLLLPEKHGVKQVIGDTLSIGGIFRTLRSLPLVIEMAREMEGLCPLATLLNYTNPMVSHVLGVVRATRTPVVGLCHGVRYTLARMALLVELHLMGKQAARKLLATRGSAHEPGGTDYARFFHGLARGNDHYRGLCAGINHMAAYLLFRRDGQDAYPLLRQAAEDPDIFEIDPVRLELMRRFGYFMTETSGHISEYLPWFLRDPEEIKRLRLRPNAYLLTCADQEKTYQEYQRRSAAGEEFIRPDEPLSVEYAPAIINAVITGQPFVFNGNVSNRGGALIENLPGDGVVEVPCLADALGIKPTAIGNLPPQLAAMMRTNMNVHDLVVEAVLKQDRQHVYHAAMLDPNAAGTLSLPKIQTLVDEMIAAHGPLMPAWLRQ